MSDNNADYALLSDLQANQEEKRSSFFSVNFIYNYPKVLVTFSGDGTQKYCFGYPLEQISKWRCFILLYISAVVVLSLSSLLFFLPSCQIKEKTIPFHSKYLKSVPSISGYLYKNYVFLKSRTTQLAYLY